MCRLAGVVSSLPNRAGKKLVAPSRLSLSPPPPSRSASSQTRSCPSEARSPALITTPATRARERGSATTALFAHRSSAHVCAHLTGVDRFKKNVSNLGGLMMDVNLKLSDFETDKVTCRLRGCSFLSPPGN